MSLLRSNELKIYLSAAGTLSDVSQTISDWSDTALSIAGWTGASGALYIGFRQKFNHRYVKIGTAASPGAAMTASYWNGSAWVAFEKFTDETDGFTRSGFLVWEEAPAWSSSSAPQEIADSGLPSEGLYWIKLTLDSNISDPFSLEAIKFLLSDDRAMKTAFPEIMNYLQTGKTHFLPQHELAKDAIVTELKVSRRIAYQEQLKNPDDWFLAATYKAIEIILDPIYGDERLNEIKKEMGAKATKYLAIAVASIDTDKSGNLDSDENPETPGPTTGSINHWVIR